LLRRGIELKGWWPYGLGLDDALLAVGLITLLTILMVIGVQTYSFLAEQVWWVKYDPPDTRAVLSLEKLFDSIAANPGAPEHGGCMNSCSRRCSQV
jgi:hypothetical protein